MAYLFLYVIFSETIDICDPAGSFPETMAVSGCYAVGSLIEHKDTWSYGKVSLSHRYPQAVG